MAGGKDAGTIMQVPTLAPQKGHLSRLDKAKADVAFMQGDHEAITQLLLALILDQVQLVEAGVRCGQLLLAPVRLVDRELLRTANALHINTTTFHIHMHFSVLTVQATLKNSWAPAAQRSSNTQQDCPRMHIQISKQSAVKNRESSGTCSTITGILLGGGIGMH